MTSPILYANNDLVAITWLSEVFPAAMVGTTLPTDNSSNSTMAASGFVLVTTLTGVPQSEVGMRHTVYSIDTFALKPSSNKPPWGRANNFAEALVRAAIKARPHRLILPANYPPAQFYTAQALSEPRRVQDPSSYARYNFNLLIHWAPVTL